MYKEEEILNFREIEMELKELVLVNSNLGNNGRIEKLSKQINFQKLIKLDLSQNEIGDFDLTY